MGYVDTPSFLSPFLLTRDSRTNTRLSTNTEFIQLNLVDLPAGKTNLPVVGLVSADCSVIYCSYTRLTTNTEFIQLNLGDLPAGKTNLPVVGLVSADCSVIYCSTVYNTPVDTQVV